MTDLHGEEPQFKPVTRHFTQDGHGFLAPPPPARPGGMFTIDLPAGVEIQSLAIERSGYEIRRLAMRITGSFIDVSVEREDQAVEGADDQEPA